jgi:drug/metabolite transporter (DMT)-like permease
MEGYLNLGLCIASTCILLTGLRQIQRYTIDLPIMIGINYLSAALVGLFHFPQAINHVFAHPILVLLATIQGFSFFILFNIMGWMTHKVGLGYMTIVAKMSLAIPVLFSWMYYGDEMTWLHFLGVGLALAAIFLVNFGEKAKDKPADTFTKGWMVAALSAVLFLGSGASDALFKILKQEYSGLASNGEYIIVLFAMAAVASLPIFVQRVVKGTLVLSKATVVGGLIMGIPNYFSIVFLAGSLRFFDGTVFYPINNTAILLVMALIGIVFYREKLNAWKAAGLLLATGAVVLLA